MPYGECKVYKDGTHYIAIPHTENPHRVRVKKTEEQIIVVSPPDKSKTGLSEVSEEIACTKNDNSVIQSDSLSSSVESRIMTKKELFEELYTKYSGIRANERKKQIVSDMTPYFKNEQQAQEYVAVNLERKKRNRICRSIRMSRKAALQSWDYFVTFTYNSELHTEESFKKKLKNKLSLLSSRKGWKYIGVWERSPEKNRLHFHGIFSIPDGTMPGSMVQVEDYSFSTHKRQITLQNTYFNTYFGRSDFEELNEHCIEEALHYIQKYMGKTGEKIVYSRGLHQYFISDIMDDDVICPFGLEDRKLLLFDDFECWDEGCYMGTVSKDTIAQMRKSD